MKIQFLAVFAIVAMIASSHGETHIFCGRKLANALAYLCPNGLLGKRSDPFMIPDYENEANYNWAWIAPHKARVLSTSRGKRQVVSECCEKPCAVEELLSYCS